MMAEEHNVRDDLARKVAEDAGVGGVLINLRQVWPAGLLRDRSGMDPESDQRQKNNNDRPVLAVTFL
jgi:hypothetical protein